MRGDFDDGANALWSLYGKEAKTHDEAEFLSLAANMDGVPTFVRVFSSWTRIHSSVLPRLVCFLLLSLPSSSSVFRICKRTLRTNQCITRINRCITSSSLSRFWPRCHSKLHPLPNRLPSHPLAFPHRFSPHLLSHTLPSHPLPSKFLSNPPNYRPIPHSDRRVLTSE